MVERIDAIGAKRMRRCVGDGRPDREPAELAATSCRARCSSCVDLRHPDGAVLDSMEAEFDAALREICDPLGLTVSSSSGSGISRRCASMPDCVAAVRRAARTVGLFGARHRLRRRPRRRLCVARRADGDDLRALPRRHQPQRGGVHLQGAMRQPARRCCCRRCSTTTGSSPSGMRAKRPISP